MSLNSQWSENHNHFKLGGVGEDGVEEVGDDDDDDDGDIGQVGVGAIRCISMDRGCTHHLLSPAPALALVLVTRKYQHEGNLKTFELLKRKR